jgi:hypothetical protein
MPTRNLTKPNFWTCQINENPNWATNLFRDVPDHCERLCVLTNRAMGHIKTKNIDSTFNQFSNSCFSAACRPNCGNNLRSHRRDTGRRISILQP